MASPLLESLMGLIDSPTLGTIAGRLNESEQSTSKGLKSSFAVILAGLANRSADASTMSHLAQAASIPEIDSALSNPAGLLGSTAGGPSGGILSALFGSNTSGIADMIARSSGLKPSSVSALLSMAVPLVLGVVKRFAGGNLNATALASQLMTQKDSILADAPAGASLLWSAPSTLAGNAQATQRKSGSPWIWPLVGLVVVLGLYLALGKRGSETAPAAVDTTAATSAVDSSQTAAASAMPPVDSATNAVIAKLGPFAKRALPDGVELNVPERGVESQLIEFLNDSTRHVSDTLWFNFDRLLFETGSSTLSADSKDQLDNVAAILRAYSAVSMKIGGYTDNRGSAGANRTLSTARAKEVMSALLSRGIVQRRLTAEGYGSLHPVASNETPEGREQNRRIAMRVTSK